MPDTIRSRGPSQQIGFSLDPGSAHIPFRGKFGMPDLGYSIHNKIKPLTWALGPVLAGSGPFVTPLSQQGLAGNTWKQRA